MSGRPMTARRFRWLLSSRGPALETWPERERAEALALLRQDRRVRDLFAEALAADEEPPAADPAALGRLCRTVQRALALPAPLERGLRWGLVVACIAAGFTIGVATIDPDQAANGLSLLQTSLPETVLAELDP